jgi:nitronate monooxygenase
MLHTRICELLEIEHPLINAPMAGVAGAELAAAVSAAGGFGLIGGSAGGPEWLRAQIRAARERTDRPFGVGFISSAPGLAELVQVALEERVAAVSHSFADPTPYVAAAHAAGVKVLNQVQSVAQASLAVQAGVDIIAAQGTEAGGHTGHSATLPLVPTVVDVAQGIPVVAAGGIGDGRGLAAVLLLGAEGAWLGTCFIASREASAAPWHKERVVQASADDTVVTRVYDLANEAPFPADITDRVLRNEFTATWQGRDEEVVARRAELQAQLAAADEAGDQRLTHVQAGIGAGLVHAVEPAGEIVRRIVAEAERILRERPSDLLR